MQAGVRGGWVPAEAADEVGPRLFLGGLFALLGSQVHESVHCVPAILNPVCCNAGETGKMHRRVALCNHAGSRLSLCFMLAAGASVSGAGVGAKAGVAGVGVPGVAGISPARKDGMKASGTPASGELQPSELPKMRDTMSKAYCVNGANPTTAPCEVQAFVTKIRAEPDAEKKKALLEGGLNLTL